MTARSAGSGDSRIRVVLVAQASPAQGGIATYAETVVADPELRRSFELRLLNTTRRAVRRGGEFSLSNLWHAIVDGLRVFRAARSAEVVHIQTALLPTLPLLRALALCRAARLGGASVLCHAHTGLANVGPFESFRPTAAQRFLLRRFRFVHAVLTVSEPGTGGLGPFMPAITIERTDNAVDVEVVQPGRADASGTILYVGTLAERKGLLDLLEAVRRLRYRGLEGWRLAVVGAGNEAGDEEAERIRAAFRSEGMTESLLGPLGPDAVRERLREAGVFVLPSRSEGQPIGILEAMASAVPVVATRVGAVPEMVRDGVDGILIEPGRPDQLADALEALLASPERRRSIGESGRRRVEEAFSLSRLRDRLGELYREAAARSPARR